MFSRISHVQLSDLDELAVAGVTLINPDSI